MAEFHDILLLFSDISIAYRVGGWGGRWQKPHLGHLTSSHDAHTMANATPVGHRTSGSKHRSPTRGDQKCSLAPFKYMAISIYFIVL